MHLSLLSYQSTVIQNAQKIDVPYEMKYPRNKFTVTLKGKGINGFTNTYEARLNELKRCKPDK